MPRVLCYVPELLPPWQTYIADQARALQRWQPVLASPHKHPEGLHLGDLATMVVGDEPPSGPEHHPGPSKPAKPSKAERERLAATPHRVPGLEALVAAERPDLIHAHYLEAGLQVADSLVAWPVPVAVTVHGADLHDTAPVPAPYQPRVRGLARLRARFSPPPELPRIHYIAVSDHVRLRLEHRGIPDDQITVLPVGVDTTRFSFSPLPRPDGAPVVLFAGALVPHKGVDVLLRAIARLVGDGVAIQARVLGDGPERARLEQVAHRHGLPVTFLGRQDHHAVRTELRRATVACVAARPTAEGGEEGLGHFLAEAMASARPVVTTRCGGVDELVRHERTGLVVFPDDPDGLAAALRRVVEDRELALQFAAAGHEWVGQRANLFAQTAALERLYDQLTEPPPR